MVLSWRYFVGIDTLSHLFTIIHFEISRCFRM